jgi:hypothetical protein
MALLLTIEFYFFVVFNESMYEIPMFYQTPMDMKIKQQGIPFVL